MPSHMARRPVLHELQKTEELLLLLLVLLIRDNFVSLLWLLSLCSVALKCARCYTRCYDRVVCEHLLLVGCRASKSSGGLVAWCSFAYEHLL
jgi:hypothetical protein